MTSDKDISVSIGKWRRAVLGLIILFAVLLGVLALTEDGRDLLKALPRVVSELGAEKDWWAGEGDIALAIPPSLSERVGSAPFHWRVLVHRSSDGEASVVLCLTRSPSALPDRPGRFFWATGHTQEPGLGDRAVIQTRVPIPWEEFSAPWHKAIAGTWRFERDGDAFSAVSMAMDARISVPWDEDRWERILAYHYWRPEDGPKPSPRSRTEEY